MSDDGDKYLSKEMSPDEKIKEVRKCKSVKHHDGSEQYNKFLDSGLNIPLYSACPIAANARKKEQRENGNGKCVGRVPQEEHKLLYETYL